MLTVPFSEKFWLFLVSVAFSVLFISKPLQVISSYNQRDRICDVKFWHLVLKSLPSLFILKKCHLKKDRESNKATFKVYCVNFKVYFSCWSGHLSVVFFLIYVTLPLRLGNIWYFCIRLLISNRLLKKCTVPNKNYTNDVLCVTTTNTSAQITGTQQRSQYRNNS